MSNTVYYIEYRPEHGWVLRQPGKVAPYIAYQDRRTLLEAADAYMSKLKMPALLRVCDNAGRLIYDVCYNGYKPVVA